MAGFMNNANFSQREFQIPFHEKELASPTYSYTESQASSNEASHSHLMNPGTQAEPNGSQSSRRAFSLSSMGSKITGLGKKPAEPKASGDKVEKVQKRRGPKPDSKPAQNRRQELNRAAQRTHRERKELYLKDLELRLSQSQATAAEVSQQKDQITQEKKALETQMKAYETENRHLKQLLEANHIPLIRSATVNSYQPSAIASMSTHSNPSLADQSLAQSDVPSYQNTANGYPLADNSAFTSYAPSMQCSTITSPNSAYSPNDPTALGFAASPMEGLATTPRGFNSFQVRDSNGYPASSFTPKAWPAVFKNPNDPKFIEFVMDLEDTCRPHADIVMNRLNNENPEEISGHALMLSAPSLARLNENLDNYQTQAPRMATADLNLLLLNSRPFNRNGEVTPIMAAHMIMADKRFPLLTHEDFKQLQKSLKAKSRCYGFGAVLEDYEILDAMNEACAKYFPPSDFAYLTQ